MNTEELIAHLLPQLRAQLASEPSPLQSILSQLTEPVKNEEAQLKLVSARDSQHVGRFPAPENVRSVVEYPRIDNRLASSSVKDILKRNPPLEGGLLTALEIDNE